MKMFDLKKARNDLVLWFSKIRKPNFKMPNFKLKGKWEKIRQKSKELVIKSTASAAPVSVFFKKLWQKAKNSKDGITGGAVVVAFTYALGSVLSYLSNVDRGSPFVIFKETDGAQIVVYPEKNKLYHEQGGKYFMADYKRKYTCEGVLRIAPAWLIPYSDNRKSYSMQLCRDFSQASGDTAHLLEKVQKYEKYIDMAKKQPPIFPQRLEK